MNIHYMEHHSIGHLFSQFRSPRYYHNHLVPLNKRITQLSSFRILFIFIQGVPAFLGSWKKLYYLKFTLVACPWINLPYVPKMNGFCWECHFILKSRTSLNTLYTHFPKKVELIHLTEMILSALWLVTKYIIRNFVWFWVVKIQ